MAKKYKFKLLFGNEGGLRNQELGHFDWKAHSLISSSTTFLTPEVAFSAMTLS